MLMRSARRPRGTLCIAPMGHRDAPSSITASASRRVLLSAARPHQHRRVATHRFETFRGDRERSKQERMRFEARSKQLGFTHRTLTLCQVFYRDAAMSLDGVVSRDSRTPIIGANHTGQSAAVAMQRVKVQREMMRSITREPRHSLLPTGTPEATHSRTISRCANLTKGVSSCLLVL